MPGLIFHFQHVKRYCTFREPKCVSEAVALLRKKQLSHDVLAIKRDFDAVIKPSGGGACASATAFNAVQVTRLLAGENELLQPHKSVLSSFTAMPELLDGRVTNAQLYRLLMQYNKYSTKGDFEVKVQTHPNHVFISQHIPSSLLSAIDMTNLFRKDAVSIIVFCVFENNELLGRLFTLLTSFSEGNLKVFAPGSLYEDLEYTVQLTPDCRTISMLPSHTTTPTNRIFELDAVFSILIRKSIGVRPNAPNVSEVKTKIDSLFSTFYSKSKELLISPRAWREHGAVFGLPALDLPKEVGGFGWNASKMIKIFYHAGKHNMNLRDAVGGGHGRALEKYTGNSYVRQVLKSVADGQSYIAIGITEPEVGSNIREMKSTSRPEGDSYIIKGHKQYVARLAQATHIILFTQAPELTKDDVRKLNAFLVPLGWPGFKFDTFKTPGLHGNSFGGLEFEEISVPKYMMLGENGEGGPIFREHFAYWRLVQTAAAIGCGKAALTQMATRMRDRHAFGGPIGRFSHLQQKLAKHTTNLEMSLALVEKAARLLDIRREREAIPLIAMAKASGIEFACQAAEDTMLTFGGEGYIQNSELGQRYADLLGMRIADGTSDVLRAEVIRRIYGYDFWDMQIVR